MRSPLLALLKEVQRLFGGSGLGRVRPLRWLYDRAYRLLKPRRVKVQGHLLWLDETDSLELATREVYEPLETALLKKELRSGQVFVDVGANIGYYTLLAARIVGAEGRVYAFEPDPSNFRLLEKNVRENGYANVVLDRRAVSNASGAARLYLNRTNKGDHRIYDAGGGGGSVSIRTVPLDGYFKKLDKEVHFIKMDIQGAEARALEGMRGLAAKNRGLKLVAEFCGKNLAHSGSDPRKFLLSLRRMGFTIREISEPEKALKSVTLEYLLNRYHAGTDDYTNLYCVKQK